MACSIIIEFYYSIPEDDELHPSSQELSQQHYIQ